MNKIGITISGLKHPDGLLYNFNFYIDCSSVDVILIKASCLDEAMKTFTAIFGIELSSHIIEVVRIDTI